jgi:hypothetical protein
MKEKEAAMTVNKNMKMILALTIWLCSVTAKADLDLNSLRQAMSQSQVEVCQAKSAMNKSSKPCLGHVAINSDENELKISLKRARSKRNN